MNKIKFFLFTLVSTSLLANASPGQIGGSWKTGPEALGVVGLSGFGLAMSPVGDFNLDGVTDLLIGTPWDGNAAGNVYLYDGVTSSKIWVINGESVGDRFGVEISTLGDMNGDGHPEFLVAAPGRDPNGLSYAGSVYVFDGLNRSKYTVIDGVEVGGNFGDGLEVLPDIDGDGYNDFVVGADKVDNPNPPAGATGIDSGAIYLYSGKTQIKIATFYGYEDDARFGNSIAPLGDLNGDSIPDLLVGAKGTEADIGNGVVPDVGRAWVLSGTDFSVIHVVTGSSEAGFFGSSVANAGDINNDGLDDFIVAAQEHTDPVIGAECGAVYIFSGATGNMLRKYIGENSGDKFGSAVWGNVDVNNDGRLDTLVGALNKDLAGQPGSFAGGIYAYSSTGELLLLLTGGGFRELLGAEIEVMGDQNGDGYPEFFVASPEYRPPNVTPRLGRILGFEFDPFLYHDNTEISATNGGLINFTLAYPISEANRNYQILFSLGTGPVWDGNVGVPLSPGPLFFRTKRGDYSFLTQEAGMMGTLDATATATAWLDQAGVPTALVGNVYYVAGVAFNANGNATVSSVPLRILITP
jgi:FG-GAP repeat protein